MIEIEGVQLRNILPEDKDILFEMINDETINEFTVGTSKGVSYEQHCAWFESISNEKNKERYMIIHNGDTVGTLILDNIDYCNSQVAISIKLLNSRGKGIGTCATKIILDYIFNEKNMNRVHASILEYNMSSRKMVEKLGFIQEGIRRQAVRKNGKYVDLVLYSLLKGEYNKSNGNR